MASTPSMSNNTATVKSKPSFHKRVLPSFLVDLSSEEGRSRFSRALSSGDAILFFQLVANFQSQSHPAFCGLAALATALNTLYIDPLRVWKHPWRYYAEDLFECCWSLDAVREKGVTLDQVVKLAQCEGAHTEVLRGGTLDEAREAIRKSVRGESEVIVASYDRKSVGQTGSGHFSPIAAYDEESESVLVLDTAHFKYAPHWIDLAMLHKATRTIDKSTGKERGFIKFAKKEESVRRKELVNKMQACKDCKDNCCIKKLIAVE